MTPDIVVQKYGGSSIADSDRIVGVANRIKASLEQIGRLVVVVSAMGDTTDSLVALAQKVSRHPSGREMDLLLASGEQVAVSALGLALQDRGIPAISLTASQCGIRTNGVFNLARIRSIDTRIILKELDEGLVVIITGFQGVNEAEEITTLGRGGSDVTAAAVASALGASVCEICTDVPGVSSADPQLVGNARVWPEISYEEAIELASSGAKVLHPRAAEICMSYQIPIHVRSSFSEESGTWIKAGDSTMEQAEVVGVTSDKGIAKITLLNVADAPGTAAQLFEELADQAISIRLIIQSASSEDRARITFILDEEFLAGASVVLERWKTEGLTSEVLIEGDVAKISIVGSRLGSTPGLAARMFKTLATEGINIDCISSSEMKVACIIESSYLDRAVKAVHAEFFEVKPEVVVG